MSSVCVGSLETLLVMDNSRLTSFIREKYSLPKSITLFEYQFIFQIRKGSKAKYFSVHAPKHIFTVVSLC